MITLPTGIIRIIDNATGRTIEQVIRITSVYITSLNTMKLPAMSVIHS